MSKQNLNNLLIIVGVVLFVGAVAVVRNRPQQLSPEADEQGQSATVEEKQLPRILEIGAGKCIPCQEMVPVLKSIEEKYKGRVTVEKINVEQQPLAWRIYGVRVIPTQIFMDATGKEVWRHEGFLPEEEIVAKLKEMGV